MNRKYFNENDVEDVLLDSFENNLKTFIRRIFNRIRSYSLVKSKYEHVFNICTINKKGADISGDLTAYLKQYSCFFKINLCGGHIVQQPNKQFRFLSPHEDNFLQLEEAFPVRDNADLDEFFKLFKNCELFDMEKFKLTSTKSHHILMSNIAFYIYPIPERALLYGSPPTEFGRWGPMRSVYTLKRDNNNNDITDDLCAFRAVALFLKQKQNPRFQADRLTQEDVHDLYRSFRRAKDPLLPEDPLHFQGAYLPTLKLLCLYKEINVVVYSTQEVSPDEVGDYNNPDVFEFNGNPTCNLSRVLFKFDAGFQHTINLIDYKNHCMLIKEGKADVVLKQYACRKCSFVAKKKCHLNTHEKTCTNIRKVKYPTGVYQPVEPLYLRAKELGFDFPHGYESYPFKLVWDIEVALKPNHYVPKTKRRRIDGEEINTFYIAEHSLISVASCTNFRHPDIEPTICYVREGDDLQDEQALMDSVVDYWESVQTLAEDHLLRVFTPLINQLDAKIAEEQEFESEFMNTVDFSQDADVGYDVEDEAEEEQESEFMNTVDLFQDMDEGYDVEDEAEEAQESEFMNTMDLFQDMDEGFYDVEDEAEEKQEELKVRMDKSPLQKLKEDILLWAAQIPIIAFNGCKYDINVVREYLFSKLIRMSGEENVSVLKKGNSYILLTTPKFRFLDMRNFVPPNYSLATLLKSFHAPAQKGVFPYEAVRSTQDLLKSFCPPKEAFHSDFKNSDISDEDWETKVHQVWEREGMRSWRDFLVYYNVSDVVPFLTAVENYESKFLGVDLWKSFISLSSLAYFIGFHKAPREDKFFKCSKFVYSLMKDNIVGGFTSATTRHFKSGETKLHNEQGKVVGKVHGFDCNSMYLCSTGGDMPTGPPRVYFLKRRTELKEQAPYGTSLKAREWLEFKRENGYPDMQTAFDVGKINFHFFSPFKPALEFHNSQCCVYFS